MRGATRPAPTFPANTYRCTRCGIERSTKRCRANRTGLCRDCIDVTRGEAA